MNNVIKAIEALEEKLVEVNEISSAEDFYYWNKRLIMTLSRIYGSEDITVLTVLKTRVDSYYPLSKAKADYTKYIQGWIKDLQRFGLVQNKKTDEKGISLNVNQHNSQTQTTNVSVSMNLLLEVLKGELRASEVEELKEILESGEEPKAKKKRFFEKIKSFGSDVASNILANLLTNPEVYQKLGEML